MLVLLLDGEAEGEGDGLGPGLELLATSSKLQLVSRRLEIVQARRVRRVMGCDFEGF
jgi:hypothetical protein